MTPEDTVDELLRRFAGRDAPPESLAELFAEDVDFFVAGDTDVVPWIGRKTGRAGVADFWAQIQDRLESEHFVVSDIMSKGDRVVVLGDLRSRLRETGRVISTEFAFDVEVSNGRITRFRMLEDTFAVARAFVP
ncbi:nuclear transport factor 2 family protein [Pseudonocardia sp. DR1-2]|uniref:nuclear transport factor 2 family protein n=1 Tax=Pseudonocardia sp. DR1-2 TaxID=2951168 RepID=UPI00204490AF|nr:nuclear transport factor 2 family protein [Pseudonocardia sp. DR1-2]MCM3849678.1 nuclear transport factor 2 family protein [Pseudonocardia sp. DR1-2]